MKLFALLGSLLSLQLIQCDVLVGRYTTPSNSLLSDSHFLEIKDFILSQHPQLKDAQVINVSTQVVAGTNYKIHFKYTNGTQYEAVVFDQPWTNHRKVLSFHEVQNVIA